MLARRLLTLIRDPVYLAQKIRRKFMNLDRIKVLASKKHDFAYLKKILQGKQKKAEENSVQALQNYYSGKVALETMPTFFGYNTLRGCNIKPACGKCFVAPETLKMQYKYEGNIFKGLNSILETAEVLHFGGEGESLMDPNFSENVKATVSSGDSRLFIPTNGILIFKHVALVTGKVKVLAISLDGSDEKMYAKLQGTEGQYHQIIRGLKDLKKEKAKSGEKYPYVYVYFILCKENLSDVDNFCDLVSNPELGIDVVVISRLGKPDNAPLVREREGFVFDFDEQIVSDEVFWDTTEYMKNRTKNSSVKIIDQIDLLYFYPGTGKKDYVDAKGCRCPMPWLTSVADPSGNVRTCSFTNKNIGNWRLSSFESIWNSKRIKKIRTEMNQHGMAEECFNTDCPIVSKIKHLAGKDNKNQLIELVKKDWKNHIGDISRYIKSVYQSVSLVDHNDDS